MGLSQLAASMPLLLWLFWGLATFAATIACIPLPFAKSFKNAVLLSACRGKLMDVKPSAALGPFSDWTVPQSWFSHFYAIGALWNALLATFFLASASYQALSTPSKAVYTITLLLLEFHLVRRFLETVGLMRYPPGARMHGIAYLFGLSYYLVVPLSVLPNTAYTSVVDIIQSKGLLETVKGGIEAMHVPSLQVLSLRTLLGITIFLAGNALQFSSHLLLARLSPPQSTAIKTRRQSSGAAKYRIPRGGAFELVSCPHYFAEIVIYLGLAVLHGTAETLPWMMVMWVVSFL